MRSLLALLATMSLATTEPDNVYDPVIDAAAADCPIAATFKRTGKAEITTVDLAVELKKADPKAKPNHIDQTCSAYFVAADADENGRLSKAEYVTVYLLPRIEATKRKKPGDNPGR